MNGIMLAATLTAALIYLTVQNSGTLALGTACWDERLTRAGRNGSCVGEFVSQSNVLDFKKQH